MHDQNLIEEARKAAAFAYAPYSGFQVGAALLSAGGDIYRACNVENASYGLTMCAERNAVFQAVAAGDRDLKALAVIGPGTEPVAPCGACRQVLVEFNPDLRVVMGSAAGDAIRVATAGELLPSAFQLTPEGGAS